MPELTYRSEDAVKGGYQSILAFEGLFTQMERVDGKFEHDQARFDYDDVVILEMEAGEPEPELKDGKHSFYVNFCKKGKEKPNASGLYVKGCMKSAEALAKARGIVDGDVRSLLNTRVVMRKQLVELYPGDEKDEDGKAKMVAFSTFCFASDDGGSQEGIEDHVRGMLTGLNKSNALRSLMGDNRTKNDPKWRNDLNNGSLLDELGLEYNEKGIILEKGKESTTEASEPEEKPF